MSAQTIYEQLRRAGMSAAGACGMLGNMQAESRLQSNNAQDAYGQNDEQYTAMVDSGGLDAGYAFVYDSIGYGLCQWTLASRKQKLLSFAKQRGVSISDEDMQVQFCLWELQNEPEYEKLWPYLCTTKGVYEAAERICVEYERPAVNNISERAGYANEWFMRLGGMATTEESPAVADVPAADWPPRELEYGMVGGDVIALQGLLFAHGYHLTIDGDFGNKTGNAVAGFKAETFGAGDTTCDYKTWDALLRR